MRNRKVYLVAGHHLKDPGAINNHPVLGLVTESALCIEQRDLVYHYLIAHNKIEVIKDDDKLTLRDVINQINKSITNDDILVDLHHNAFNTRATGVEVIVQEPRTKIVQSLSENICKRLSDIMGIPNRGVKGQEATARGRIAILQGKGHRILTETCFMDNDSDLEAYWKNKHLVAEAIAFEIESVLQL